ncbi:MAG: hypothetical protein AAF772_14590 [Acidobacteriota bacterium]
MQTFFAPLDDTQLPPPHDVQQLHALLAAPDLRTARIAIEPPDDDDPDPLRRTTVVAAAHLRGDAVPSPTSGHRLALERLNGAPDALLRLLIETARGWALDRPLRGIDGLARARGLLHALLDVDAAAAARVDRARVHDLAALALAYRAEALDRAASGRDDAARALLRAADQHAGHGTGDREIASQLHQIHAAYLVDRRRPLMALHRLAPLRDALDGSRFAGRRAAIDGQIGALLLMLNDGTRAEKALQRALAEPAPWHALTRLHHRLRHNRAAAALAAGRHAEARAQLVALASEMPHPALHAVHAHRHARLVGLSHLYGPDASQAEAPLRTAFEGFLRDDHPIDATRTLADLARLYVLTHRPRDFSVLVDRTLALPTVRRLLLDDLEPRRRRVAAVPWAAAQLDGLIAQLRAGVSPLPGARRTGASPPPSPPSAAT